MTEEDSSDATSGYGTKRYNSPVAFYNEKGSDAFASPDSHGITPMPSTQGTDDTIISRRNSIDHSTKQKLTFSDSDNEEEELNKNTDLSDNTKSSGFLNAMNVCIPKSKEALYQKLSHPTVKFAGGIVVGKLLVAPTLSYASDYISDNNSDKSIVYYYYEATQKLASTLIKSGLFYAAYSFLIAMKMDPAAKATSAKIVSDFVYNGALALTYKQSDMLYKMASVDYLKGLSMWILPGATSKLLSMTSAMNYLPDINKLYHDYPGVVGAGLGASAEIINLAQIAFNELKSLGETFFHNEEM